MSQCERISIPFEDGQLDALLETPRGTRRESALLLAHGSGANMDSKFLTNMSALLADRGFLVLRFDYPYMQRARETGRRRPPDRREILERAHRAALLEFARQVPKQRILLAGKSLGGRIASYLAAEDNDAGRTAGLVFFGYPLHPRKQEEKIRCDHFPILPVPALFLQGTRDELCKLELLESALATYAGAATLQVIEAADHGFDVLKRSGRDQAEVLAELADAVAAWDKETFPAQ